MNDSDLSRTSSLTTDLQILHHARLKHSKNSMIGYLNINSLRNKLTVLSVIIKYLSLDHFVLYERKLDESSQFTLEGYETRARSDKDKFGTALIEYVQKGLICKKIAKYEPKLNEYVCSESNYFKKKWVIFSIYRPTDVKRNFSKK